MSLLSHLQQPYLIWPDLIDGVSLHHARPSWQDTLHANAYSGSSVGLNQARPPFQMEPDILHQMTAAVPSVITSSLILSYK